MVRLDHSFILSRFDLSLHSRIGCILGLVIVGSVVAIIMSLFVFPGQCMADVSDDYLTWAEPL